MHQDNSMEKKYSSLFPVMAVIAISYWLMGLLALKFVLVPGLVTPIWPGSGIALAAMMLYGKKVWPAVFLGSFLVNMTVLITTTVNAENVIPALSLALLIGLGASLQAIFGLYLWDKMKVAPNLLENYRNIIALFMVAFISCTINATLGNLFLFITKVVPYRDVFTNWITWWLGDASGIYLFTPFVLCWLSLFTLNDFYTHFWKAIQLCALIILSGLIGLNSSFPLAFLIIPSLLVAALHFGSRGATFALVAFSILTLWLTSIRHGAFINEEFTLNESILLFQGFIGVVTATTLIVLTIVNELKRTYRELEIYSRELEEKVAERTMQLQDRNQILQERGDELNKQNVLLEETLHNLQTMQKRIITHEKQASLGSLMAGISLQMRNPLNFVINFAELALEEIHKGKEWVNAASSNPEKYEVNTIEEVLTSLNMYLESIQKHGKKANTVVEKMVLHTSGNVGNYQVTDLNELVEEVTTLSYYSSQSRNVHFKVQIDKRLDPTLQPINTLPQALSQSLVNILNNALYSVSFKKNLGYDKTFIPTIAISTKNLGNRIAIAIKDNGMGIVDENRDKVFLPFFTTKEGNGVGYGLTLSKDLVEHQLGGEIQLNSVEGQFAEFTILLPCEPVTFDKI
jgi:signal transduction histidine kinase